MFRKIIFDRPSPFELYLPEGPGASPLICITPLLGRLLFLEDLLLERYLARFFASNGFATAVIDRPIFEFNPACGLEQIQSYLEESLSRNRQVLDFLAGQKEIDSAKMGSFGISFGAVINSLWASLDSRLKAHVFALGGGNLPEIFVTSRDPLMRSYYQAALKSKGGGVPPLTKENLKENLKKIFRFDPLKTAASIPRENVFMVLALFDRVICFRYGLALRDALGNPRTFYLPLGHYSSIVSVPFLKRKVLSFFRSKWLLTSEPAEKIF